jgi:hypothetical protein
MLSALVPFIFSVEQTEMPPLVAQDTAVKKELKT